MSGQYSALHTWTGRPIEHTTAERFFAVCATWIMYALGEDGSIMPLVKAPSRDSQQRNLVKGHHISLLAIAEIVSQSVRYLSKIGGMEVWYPRHLLIGLTSGLRTSIILYKNPLVNTLRESFGPRSAFTSSHLRGWSDRSPDLTYTSEGI